MSGRAASAPSSKSDAQGSFQVTDTHKETGELAREWIADVFENVDYERVMSSADAFEASGEYIKQADEDEELRYGEFDMGFFVAVVEACEPLLDAWKETGAAIQGRSWTWAVEGARFRCWPPRSGRGRGALGWSTCPCCTPSRSRRRGYAMSSRAPRTNRENNR